MGIVASSAGAPAAGQCPSVSTTTITSYSSTTFVAASTYTSTYPIYENVETVALSSTSMVYVSPHNTTVTSTVYLSTSIVVEPAQATVTAPTPSGFTPVLCEASWVQPTVSSPGVSTEIVTGTTYSGVTVSETSTSTATLIVDVKTSTIDSLVTITTTVTASGASTSTRSSPTETVYAACASNNIVELVPDGQTIFNVDLQPDVDQQLVTAIDEKDCCALCQASSTCVGSIYLAKYPFGDLGSRRCDLLHRKDQVCDPLFSGANVTSKAVANPYAQSFISNSGCGQILYAPDLYQQAVRKK